MIYDRLENYSRYPLNEKFLKAFEFLENYNEEEPGRYEICDGVYATVRSAVKTVPLEERTIEAHTCYADVQYIIEGSEWIGISLSNDYEVLKPYSVENDVTYYKGNQIELFPMKSGYFMVIFPHEKHAPSVGDGEELKKINMKVRIKD